MPLHLMRAHLGALGFAAALALLCVACQTPNVDNDAHSRKGYHPEQTQDVKDERSVERQLAQTPDGDARFALLDGLAHEDERAGRILDYYHVLDLIESDGAISPGRRSLAASELSDIYSAEGEYARGGRMLDDAKRYAAEVKDAERERLRRDPTSSALRAEAHFVWRYSGQYDVALRLDREANELGWRDLADSALAPARREAAVDELTDAAMAEVFNLIRCNRAAEALSQVDELRWDLDNDSQLHPTPLQRAKLAGARALALTAFDDFDAALASIDSAIEGFRAAGLTPASTHYAESLRLRLLIALAMGRIGDYRADVAGLQMAASANPREGSAGNVRLDRLLAFAANGDWAGAQQSIAEEARRTTVPNGMRLPDRVWYRINRPGNRPADKFRASIELLYRLEDPGGSVSKDDIAAYVEPLLNSGDDWNDDSTRGGIIDDGVLAFSMMRLMNNGVQGEALAFRIAELFHSNATQGAMNDGAARVAAKTPALRTLVEQEVTLRYQLTSATPPLGAENKLHALRARIVAEFPRYRQLVAPAIPTPEAVAGVLHANEAYVDLYAGREASYAFVVRSGAPLHAVVLPVKREVLARQIAALRAAFDAATPPQQPGDLAGFDLVAAAQLYRALIAPIEPDLQGAKTVYLSTSGILSSIPFEVLLRRPASNLADADWWINSTTPVRVPSGSALVSARAMQGAHASDALVAFADPSFDGSATAPQAGPTNADSIAAAAARVFPIDARTLLFDYRSVPPLPETLGEANEIAKALGVSPQHSVISGLAASRSHVLSQDLSNERVVLFATHGVIPGEVPGLRNSGLALAYEGRGLPDSILTADDIVTLRLNADWVVLSACNTGLATGAAGDSVSALTRAFFAAGARTLLVTQWAVESRSAALVTTGLFEAYARDPALSKAEALAQIERAMAEGKDGALYRHPYFWGAYFLAGDAER